MVATSRCGSGVCGLAALLLMGSADCSVTVPAGARLTLNGGAMHLGCTDLTVGGNLRLGNGMTSGVRNLAIAAGTAPEGSLDADSGSIQLGGNWSNGGNFNAGTGQVQVVDACGAGSSFDRTTTFHDLSLSSNLGKIITVPPGITLFALHALTIQGTLANPIQITSGVPTNAGYLHLAAGGTQNIAHVGVSDNHATGQPLAPFQVNEGGTGNALGWFGVPLEEIRPVPATDPWGLTLLATLIAGIGWVFRPDRLHPMTRKFR